ncbi:MAG: hypothetical protein DHS20C18_15010 [Saprospiraceae bacterium]|nr:MAG: hypothetical protein DHS20C18_15010 [Saprospiraceae bacterium]
MSSIDWSTITELLAYHPSRPLLFNSVRFLALFLAFFSLYIALRRRLNWRLVYTLAFSLYFYYLSSGFYFFILLLSTVVDFTLGHFIYRASNKTRKRLFLGLSLGLNLGLLGYFKYTNFLIDLFNGSLGTHFHFQDIFLPVGISFFTFQTLSYSIDIYREKLIPLTEGVHGLPSLFRNFLDFAFFVCFFPQLVAGPIVRAADFIPQIRKRLALTEVQLGQGILLIAGGLFKKAVISDYISVNFVDRVFENPVLYSGLENLLAVYGYALQIYCDFSGYSDMAIGLALLLGFQLPENFRTPYQSKSIQEFWRRWHISLSTWLRDYLYISLGGNRKGGFRTYVNLMITMLLGGLWHGASWVFILWGFLHGIGLALDRFLKNRGKFFELDATRALVVLLLLHLVGQGLILWQYADDPELLNAYTRGNVQMGLFWITLFVIAQIITQLKWSKRVINDSVSKILVFHFVCFCWIFFRAGALANPMPPMQTAGEVLGQLMTNFQLELLPQVLEAYKPVLFLMLLGYLLHFLPRNWANAFEKSFIRWPLIGKATFLAAVIWIVIQTASSEVVPFIYFQF